MKTKVGIIIALFVVIVLGGCNFFQKKEKSSNKKEVIKIGAILPLTGDLAFLGVPQKNAIDLAVNYYNKNSDLIKLKVIYGDSKGESSTAVNIVNKMINIDHINYYIAFLTGVNEAIKPVLEKENKILFALSFYPPLTENTNNVLRIFYDIVGETNSLIRYIDNNTFRRIAIIRSTDAVTEYETTNYLLPKLKSFQTLDIKYKVGQKRVNNEIAKVKYFNPDLIIMLGFGSDFVTVMKEIKIQNLINKHIIGGIGFLEASELMKNESLLNNIIFTIPSFLVNNKSNFYQDISKKYYDKYNRQITYDGVYAFDNITVINSILKRIKLPYRTGEVVKNIKNHEFNGLTGKMVIDNNGNLLNNIILVKSENGKLEKIN